MAYTRYRVNTVLNDLYRTTCKRSSIKTEPNPEILLRYQMLKYSNTLRDIEVSPAGPLSRKKLVSSFIDGMAAWGNNIRCNQKYCVLYLVEYYIWLRLVFPISILAPKASPEQQSLQCVARDWYL